MKKTCICGNAFTIVPSEAARRRHCSMACKNWPVPCAELGCTKLARRRNLCVRHALATLTAAEADSLRRRLAVGAKRVGACLEWQGKINRGGYGEIKIFSKYHSIPRVVLRLSGGPLPPGIQACHRCDNRACIDEAHLFRGTQADNTADMVAKGRQPRTSFPGELNPRAKLSEQHVRDIRASAESGRLIAKRLGISPTVVFKVRRKESWKHVE